MTSDERLEQLERWLAQLYADAEREMRGKWDEYFKKHQEISEKMLQKIRDAKDDEIKKKLTRQYTDYLKDHTITKGYFRNMIRELSRQYHNVNVQAARMVNKERAAFFADGYNISADRITHIAMASDIGIRFDLCSAEAVEWLANRQNDLLLPGPREPLAREDMTWNLRNINSQMTQGIVQGESIPRIAERLRNVSDMNLHASIRNARTMATGCQNAGRVEAMRRAEEWGVKTRKRWLCTHDGRTRHSHLAIDGETVEEDREFSNGCRYPGDPLGPAREVYNCRCSLITVIDGFSSNLPKGKEDAVHVTIDGEEIERGLTYYRRRETEAEREHREAVRRLLRQTTDYIPAVDYEESGDTKKKRRKKRKTKGTK